MAADNYNTRSTLSFVDGFARQLGLPLKGFDPQSRTKLDLSGTWRKLRFQADHTAVLTSRPVERISAIQADGFYLPEFDDSAWDTKTLPGVENSMPVMAGDPDGPEDYQDGVWYRRTFDAPAAWKNQHITLNFLSVNYVVDVWVNGRWVGYHEGGYTPFAFDITPLIQYGEVNTLVLRVDNPPWDNQYDTLPSVPPDWWNYTGVIHDIYLEITPPVYVVRVDVLTPDTSGKVQISVLLQNSVWGFTHTAELSIGIYDTDPTADDWLASPHIRPHTQIGADQQFTVELSPGEVRRITVEAFIPHVKLWTPQTPNLYVAQATVKIPDSGKQDTYVTQFGVRTIRTEGHKLLLNDAPILLVGVARHEDWPDTGRTATWERIVSDFRIIQGLNVNFVRTAHYPNHIYTYILLDRLGLMAAVEIPVWQATEREYQAQEQRGIADQMWREMIFSNRNRPSILMWSSNNESREIPFRTAYINRLLDDFRANYPDGRLIIQSAAADATGADDSSHAPLDLAGWTMYFGIFHGSTYYAGTAKFLHDAHTAFPDKPILNTEYGIWSGGESSEADQVEVFNETFRALTEVAAWNADGQYNPDGFLAGLVWWTAFDWYTHHTKLQTMGLMTMDRQREKQVAGVLRAAYHRLRPT